MENQIVKANTFKTSLAKLQDTFVNMLVKTGSEMNIAYTDEQKVCALNMISVMNNLLLKEGMDFKQVDQSQVTNILQTVSMLRLNASAQPRECYVILRNVKAKDGTWKKEFELGIEGDGNDKILREYGVDIKKVYSPWLVRENDEFTYPAFNGLEIEPPTWRPKDYTSKVILVVYPIIKTDDMVEYLIAERESVAANLKAHISNNLLKNNSIEAQKKADLLKKIEDMTLDELYQHADVVDVMSPAWKNPGAKESMIIRKMRNNAIKKYPKDFKNAFAATAFENTYDDYDQYKEDSRINKEEALEVEVQEKMMNEPLQVETVVEPQNKVIEADVKVAKANTRTTQKQASKDPF